MSNKRVKLNKHHIDEVKNKLGWTNRNLCELWNIEYESHISRWINKGGISIDLVKILAQRVGCDYKYLLSYDCGGDDFFNEEERNKIITDNKICDYNKTIEYLKTLGIDIELNAYLICSSAFIVAYYDEWKERLDGSNHIEDKIEKLNADNTHLSHCFKLDSDLSWWDYRWIDDDSSVSYEIETQYSVEEIRNTATKDSKRSSDYEFPYDGYEIHIMYEVLINNEIVNVVPVGKMSDFLWSLDNLCKSSVYSLLTTSTFSNEIFKWSS